MKKFLTLCSKNTPDCRKVQGGERHIIEKEYTDEQYAAIRGEADKYKIFVFSSWGHERWDYTYRDLKRKTK